MASWCTYRDPSWKSIANTGENVVAAIKVIISWIDKQENMNCKCSKIVFTLSTEIVYKIYISDQKISGVCWCWCEFMIEIQLWGTGHSYIICASIELFTWLFSYCCTSFHNDSLTSDGNFFTHTCQYECNVYLPYSSCGGCSTINHDKETLDIFVIEGV